MCVKEVTDGVFVSLFHVRTRLGNGNSKSSIVKVIIVNICINYTPHQRSVHCLMLRFGNIP